MLQHLTTCKYALSYEQQARYRALINLGLSNADFVTKSAYDEKRDSWVITLNEDLDVELSVKQIPSALTLISQDKSVNEIFEDRLFNGLYNVNDAIAFLKIACYGL